jgi:predicted GNAT family N-acyltransferase
MQKCFEIRKDVFVNEQQCDPKDEYEFEEESTHYLLSEKNIPLATARYRKTENGIKMERFAVLKSKRGKGYGIKILKKMILDLSHSKLTKYLHAQVQVVKFYEKVGFKKIGGKFDEVGIMHYKMILE